MTVSTFEPKTLTATEAARRHLRAQIAESGSPGLRLGVKESGCNGFMYTLDFLDAPGGNDRAHDLGDGVSIYVREEDLPMVQGTEIDLVTEGLNSSLRFKNPRASAYCGCGESFAIADAAH
jgi:iron-sulfur cluster assembly accessory protein